MKRGLIAVALALIMIFAVLAAFGCNRTENGGEDTVETSTEQTEYDNPDKYVGEYSAVNGTFGGVDDLGRVLSIDGGAGLWYHTSVRGKCVSDRRTTPYILSFCR